ncbi:MAG: S8 family serine peptidase [Saprospiraceae bacterium]|nr:S8 family serine peptidase [Saprospiraceae bacterium]
MLSIIYPFAFICSLVGLLCWSFLESNRIGRLFRNLFIAGILVWMVSLYSSPLEFHEKIGVALRDLLVIGLGGLVMNWAKANKIMAFLVLVATGIFLQLNYLNVLRSSLISSSAGSTYAEIELMVDLADVPLEELESILKPYKARLSHAFEPQNPEITDLDDYYLIDLPGNASPSSIGEVVDVLEQSGLIDWIEHNEEVRIPLDELKVAKPRASANKFGVSDPDVDKQWSFAMLNIEELHQVLNLPTVTPKKKALIAIIDTGVDGNHEDLKDRYVTTNKKYDTDIQGHGTHVAGIAAAVSNNGLGIASFDPGKEFVSVTGIKVLSDRGFGTQATIIKGMIEAADRGADVISMSLGGRSTDKKEITYEKAVKYCNDLGAIVVVAAGNSGSNSKSYAPANAKGVITVTATTQSGDKAAFSNTVEDVTFGVAAPGDNIYSTFPGDSYKSFRGTSMACPFVASLAGIMKSIEPSLTTAQIHRIISVTGHDTNDTPRTGKLIQPAECIRALLD